MVIGGTIRQGGLSLFPTSCSQSRQLFEASKTQLDGYKYREDEKTSEVITALTYGGLTSCKNLVQNLLNALSKPLSNTMYQRTRLGGPKEDMLTPMEPSMCSELPGSQWEEGSFAWRLEELAILFFMHGLRMDLPCKEDKSPNDGQ